MKRKAIYPGTFDPFTYGHIDIVNRATQLFDVVVIAVAESARKSPLFNLQERLSICHELFKNNARVEIKKFNTLAVHFAQSENAAWIIKGLRNTNDFDYELQMAMMNRRMANQIETVFLPANPEHIHVSSTMVREIISLGEGTDISLFVPPLVADYLARK